MRFSLGRLLGASLCFLLAPITQAADALPPGLSGTWYNPQHSGQGLSITVHSEQDALVYWFTGDRTGQPLLLYAETKLQGSALRGDALESHGIRFGDFDPRTNRLTRWGRIELELLACDRLTLRYDADGPAGGPDYGRGQIEMRKLAGADDVPCVEPRPTEGLFISPEFTRVSATDPFDSRPREHGFNALFSADGSIWFSFERGRREHGTLVKLSRAPSGSDFLFGYGYTDPVPGGVRVPDGFGIPSPQYHPPTALRLETLPRRVGYAVDHWPEGFSLAPQGRRDASRSYRRDAGLATTAGVYESHDAAFNHQRLAVSADGRLSGFDRYMDGPACRYEGTLRKVISPSIEFEASLILRDCGERDGPYAGKAWVEGFDRTGAPSGLRLATLRTEGWPLAFQFSAPRAVSQGGTPAATTVLPPGLTGTWYHPQQAGHGLSITVNSTNDALVYWYTGDRHGNSLLLYAETQLEGRTMRGDALESRGIRFGEFAAGTNRLIRWGDVELELLACDRLTLRYNANGPAGGADYGVGEIEMRKLAGVDEVPCVEPRPIEGLFVSPELTATYCDHFTGRPYEGGLNALYSADGSIWLSFVNGRRQNGTVVKLTRLPGDLVHVGSAHRAPAFSTHAGLPLAFDPPTGAIADLALDGLPRQLGYRATLGGEVPALNFSLVPHGKGDPTSSYRRAADLTSVAGSYESVDASLNAVIQRLNIAEDGRFAGFEGYRSGTCQYHGTLRKTIVPSIEFEATLVLEACGERDGTYSGKAWINASDSAGRPGLRIATIRTNGEPIAFQFAAPRAN